MFRRLLPEGWGIYFAGVALVFGLPRRLVRHTSLAAPLPLGFLLMPAREVHGVRRVYTRQLRGKSHRIEELCKSCLP
jgi:hypothetical protein